MPAVAGQDYQFNQSRVEEVSQNADVRALAEGGTMPNTSVGQLADVEVGTPLLNQALAWDGAKWVPTTLGGGGSGMLQPDEAYIVGPVEEASQQVLLAAAPVVNSLMISINGLDQTIVDDYTLNVNLVAFVDPLTIRQGDKVIAKYQ